MFALLLLLACHPRDKDGVDPPDPPADADGDGSPDAEDCDDAEASVHPGATEVAGDGVDQDCDGVDPFAAGAWAGLEADEGLGCAVALRSGSVWAGAPWYREGGAGAPAGRVWRNGAVLLTGAAGDRLGASLVVLDSGALIAGAPGAGRLQSDTLDLPLRAEQLGAHLVARGERWAASAVDAVWTAEGAAEPTSVATLREPDALALLADGRVVVGYARGPVAVQLGELVVARVATGDEAGAALLAADADGDGDEELLVGAPGVGRLYVIDPAAPPASLDAAVVVEGTGGRFGAALASPAAGLVLVGAPNAGEAANGAVWVVDHLGSPTAVLRGAGSEEQLGFALAATPDAWAAGAPGAASAPGSVTVTLR